MIVMKQGVGYKKDIPLTLKQGRRENVRPPRPLTSLFFGYCTTSDANPLRPLVGCESGEATLVFTRFKNIDTDCWNLEAVQLQAYGRKEVSDLSVQRKSSYGAIYIYTKETGAKPNMAENINHRDKTQCVLSTKNSLLSR
jgi:hypothetical protein